MELRGDPLVRQRPLIWREILMPAFDSFATRASAQDFVFGTIRHRGYHRLVRRPMFTFLLFLSITLLTTTAAADRACSTLSPAAIPDNNATGVTVQLEISPQSAPIADLDLDLDITHTWVGDLVVKLLHVDTGKEVIVIDRMGKPASTFGCSGNGLNINLDDEGTGGPVEDLCGSPTVPTSPPSFTPNNPLSFFDGDSIGGTWRLVVTDAVGGDIGTVDAFCLQWNTTDLAVSQSSTAFIAAVGSRFSYQMQFSNNGPFDAESPQLLAQVPAQFAITDFALSAGSLFPTSGGPFTVFVGTVPSLAAGETVTLGMEAIPSAISSLIGGPPVDTTRLLISAPAGAPTEMPVWPINFDPSLHPAVVSAPIVLANDGIVAPAPGGSTSDACEPLSAVDVSGKIVLVDGLFAPLPGYSGEPPPPPCGIGTQINNAQVAGAIGLIVQNVTNNAGPFLSPPSSPPTGGTLPVVVVPSEFGALLRGGGAGTILLGRPEVWETFGLVTISGGGSDDLNPSNDVSYFTTFVGRDFDDDATADAIDGCPSDATKTTGGLCGCGQVDSSLDFNFNSVADCVEDPSTITPPKPKLRQVPTGVRVTMPKLTGARYALVVSIKAPGQKKAIKRRFRGNRNVLVVPNVAPGSSLTATYTLSLEGPSILASRRSALARIKTK